MPVEPQPRQHTHQSRPLFPRYLIRIHLVKVADLPEPLCRSVHFTWEYCTAVFRTCSVCVKHKYGQNHQFYCQLLLTTMRHLFALCDTLLSSLECGNELIAHHVIAGVGMTCVGAQMQVATAKRRTRVPRSTSVTAVPDQAQSRNAPADQDSQIWHDTCLHMQPPAWQLPSHAPVDLGQSPPKDFLTQRNNAEPFAHQQVHEERRAAERKLADDMGVPGDGLCRGGLVSNTWTGSALCPLQGKVARTGNAAMSPGSFKHTAPSQVMRCVLQ